MGTVPSAGALRGRRRQGRSQLGMSQPTGPPWTSDTASPVGYAKAVQPQLGGHLSRRALLVHTETHLPCPQCLSCTSHSWHWGACHHGLAASMPPQSHPLENTFPEDRASSVSLQQAQRPLTPWVGKTCMNEP